MLGLSYRASKHVCLSRVVALAYHPLLHAETGSYASRFMRRHILVEYDNLLGIFVDLIVGDLAPGDFAEDHAPVGIDDGSVGSGASIGKP